MLLIFIIDLILIVLFTLSDLTSFHAVDFLPRFTLIFNPDLPWFSSPSHLGLPVKLTYIFHQAETATVENIGL